MNKPFIPTEEDVYNKKNTRNSKDKILIIKLVYIFGMILWTITISMLGLYNHDVICMSLIFVPYIIFLVSMLNVRFITKAEEVNYFSYDYLSVGLLIFLPLMSWMNLNNKSSHPMFITIVIVALAFTMAAMIDIFIKPEYLSVMKHIRSILQTCAMILLIYAVYLYYVSNY